MVFFGLQRPAPFMLSGKIIKWIFKGKSIVINRKSVPTKSKNILGQSFVLPEVY